MKLWILSDLHEDAGRLDIVRPSDFDVFVCAGDILSGDMEGSIERVADLAGGKPAVFVAGNHEWMTSSADETAELGRAAAQRTGVHWLECGAAKIGGVTFAGATLWESADARFPRSIVALNKAAADVVVTHFPPSFPMRRTPGGARLWIFGHQHGFDARNLRRQRFIRNAVGYRGEEIDGLPARLDFVTEFET